MSVPVGFARVLNGVAPGAGLALAGAPWTGAALAALFTASACGASAGWLLAPENIPLASRWLLLAGAVLAYVLAQLRLAHILRREAHNERIARRARVLRRVTELLEARRVRDARTELAALLPERDDDLLVALIAARVESACGESGAANAWEALRRLDRHRIYAQETARALAREGGAARGDVPNGPR